MATADMITISDVEEYLPDVLDYGILSFDASFERSRQDIFRKLRIDWWPRANYGRTDLSVLGDTIEMDETKLTESQFTRACVFHCLAYYIMPQLTRHDPERDRFIEMADYYKSRFNEEFDNVLKDGVEYDDDGDGTIQDAEKQSLHYGRLVR
jgi:hypothetical protein